MNRFIECLIRVCPGLLGLCLFTPSANAQAAPPDSVRLSGSSTLVKIRPFGLLVGGVDLAVEQTLGRRSSVELDVYQTVVNNSLARFFGSGQSASAAFLYYPLAAQSAPAGFYVGAKLGYARVGESDLVRLLTLFTSGGAGSQWSGQVLAGYQYCFRRHLVLEAQGSLPVLQNTTVSLSSAGQPTYTERQTTFLARPRLNFGIGYRFQHRRN